jgi:hypothetical protein
VQAITRMGKQLHVLTSLRKGVSVDKRCHSLVARPNPVGTGINVEDFHSKAIVQMAVPLLVRPEDSHLVRPFRLLWKPSSTPHSPSEQ